MAEFPSTFIHILAGLAALCFGRRLFWLFVGVAGFVAAFEFVPALLPGQEPWVVLAIALLAGIVGAFLAVSLQYVAAAIAGFVAGSYASVPIAAAFGSSGWIPIAGGVLGVVVMLLVFDWALIFLSAATGARALVSVSGLHGFAAIALWVGLSAFGIGIQASLLSRAKHPLARRRHREHP